MANNFRKREYNSAPFFYVVNKTVNKLYGEEYKRGLKKNYRCCIY